MWWHNFYRPFSCSFLFLVPSIAPWFQNFFRRKFSPFFPCQVTFDLPKSKKVPPYDEKAVIFFSFQKLHLIAQKKGFAVWSLLLDNFTVFHMKGGPLWFRVFKSYLIWNKRLNKNSYEQVLKSGAKRNKKMGDRSPIFKFSFFPNKNGTLFWLLDILACC